MFLWLVNLNSVLINHARVHRCIGKNTSCKACRVSIEMILHLLCNYL